MVDFELFRATLLAVAGELARQAHLKIGKNKRYAITGHLRVLRWVQHYLDQHYAEPLTVKQVAAMTRYSPNYLDTLFAKWAGQGILAYLIDRRMQQAMWLCQNTELAIQQIGEQVGYGDPFYFSRAFRRYHGQPPSQARHQRS